jgi:hypothetical protein
MVRGQWVYAGGRAGNKPRSEEKIAITTACESLIADVLLPKYLPEITPSEFNYPIAIYGKWHGNKYRFITRYRSDQPDSFTRESKRPLRSSSMSRMIVSTFHTIGTPASGTAFISGSPLTRRWRSSPTAYTSSPADRPPVPDDSYLSMTSPQNDRKKSTVAPWSMLNPDKRPKSLNRFRPRAAIIRER